MDRATNQAVPFEQLPVASARAGTRGGGGRRIRFLATDVPAVGYKCYTIRQAKTDVPPRSRADSAVENAYYRITLDPGTGAVASLFDKELNRELVDASSPYRFNQYLLATG